MLSNQQVVNSADAQIDRNGSLAWFYFGSTYTGPINRNRRSRRRRRSSKSVIQKNRRLQLLRACHTEVWAGVLEILPQLGMSRVGPPRINITLYASKVFKELWVDTLVFQKILRIKMKVTKVSLKTLKSLG